MFDLEKAIAQWRRQMIAGGIKSNDDLNELEGHLRDDIDQEIRAGQVPQSAFQLALDRLGGAKELKNEFAKARRDYCQILKTLKEFFFGVRQGKLPPLELLTVGAQQALALAREEAPRLNHDFVGTEHVLLGVLKSESDIVAGVMRRLGLQSETIRAEIEKVIGPGLATRRVASAIPFTPRAKRALALAVKEAESLEQRQVKPEHIFLGLIKENEGAAGLVLRNLGVDLNRAREEIISEMNFRKGIA